MSDEPVVKHDFGRRHPRGIVVHVFTRDLNPDPTDLQRFAINDATEQFVDLVYEILLNGDGAGCYLREQLRLRHAED
jgi:hypothetical protein